MLATADLHAEYQEYWDVMFHHGCECVALDFTAWLLTLDDL